MTNESAETTETRGEEPDEIRWTLLELEDLVAVYWDVIAPAFEAAGHDPKTDRPTYDWLSANGFRGLIYALREYHDRTFAEFWADDLGLEAEEMDYDWGIDNVETIDLLEAYLESRRERGELSESSVETLRYRLATYVRAYAAANETADLLTPVAPTSDVAADEAVDAAWAAVDSLDTERVPRTMRRIHEAVNDWYSHLVRRKRAAVNPVAGLEDEYRWSRRTSNGTENSNESDGPTNPALAAEHVRALYQVAETAAERLLVVALCGWGLRSGEVAALHRSQLVLDGEQSDVPYLSFSERKNGPGEVSILYGRDVAEERLSDLVDREDWNGYLFPSQRSASGHINRQTVLNRFDTLAMRAGVPATIGGVKPVPQMGRRFWYDAYTSTQEHLITEVEEIAAEQGSASASVVLENYLSAERRRDLRRAYMREQLAEAFEVASCH